MLQNNPIIQKNITTPIDIKPVIGSVLFPEGHIKVIAIHAKIA